MSAQGQALHRLAGALDKRRREACAGPCTFCPNASIGYIESWDLRPKGVCGVHAAQGDRLGYTIYRPDGSQRPSVDKEEDSDE